MAIASEYRTVREISQAVQAADPAVLLVSPRILQRVIRIDRRIPTFGLSVPHRKSYFLSRQRLFDIVSRFELEVDVDHAIPEQVVLLERPDEEDLLERPAAEILCDYWRALFHVRVHLALERQMRAGNLTDTTVLERLRELGAAEYAEIRSVLQRDELLLPPRSELSTYSEFAAVFLELWHFAPDQLVWHFPALGDGARVARQLEQLLDHEALYAATRVPGAADPGDLPREEDEWTDAYPPPVEVVNVDPLKPSPPSYWRNLARAEKVGALGNVVKAAILRKKAAREALPDRVRDVESLAHAELQRLARRLRPVLGLTEEETRDWAEALTPLLKHADGLRSADARLLYDLQKVCVEHERGVYSLDLISWVRSWGRVPIRRALPLLRQVLVTKHLQSASRKLTNSRLSGPARARLSQLIQAAEERAKQRLRDRVRPRIIETLEAEGLSPQNVPERVAFRKIVEELLDRIVAHGYLNMGHLRDTLSQNNLKLQDLTSLWELLFGDLLLRIDRRLAWSLDGIYHRGPIYLRMSQRLSAMAFGTPLGRSLTRYVALPFGGAFLLVEFLRHILHLFLDREASLAPEIDNAEQLTAAAHRAAELSSSAPQPWLSTASLVVGLGFFLMLLIENTSFRERCIALMRRAGQLLRKLFFDWPAMLLKLSWVRRFLDSPFYGVLMNYLFKPLVFTTCCILPYEHRFGSVTWGTGATIFLAINLLLNSPLGRYADVLITEQILRGWRELQMRVFAAALRMIMEVFQWVLQTMEHVVYTVDEWLRFRTGERGWVLVVKAMLGVGWALITYVVRIYITLLIEPQINPIKHFPVVTVSHKIMLPFSIHLTGLLATPLLPLGKFWANTIAGTTVFLLPGVFGFLAWELKENWRLYASNRPATLRPRRIGSHNETMAGMLRIGFHSGTVPRLFSKLRSSWQRARRTRNWKAIHKYRAGLHHVEETVRRFVDRELIALLAESPAWQDAALEVRDVHVDCHRVRIQVWHRDPAFAPLQISFEDRGGWLAGALDRRDWLEAQPADRQRSFLVALGGLFKYAGVDFEWRQLLEGLGGTNWWWFDMNTDGLLVWKERDDKAPTLIQLRDTGAAENLTPPPAEIQTPSDSERQQILLDRSPIYWREWVAAWESRQGDAPASFSAADSPPRMQNGMPTPR